MQVSEFDFIVSEKVLPIFLIFQEFTLFIGKDEIVAVLEVPWEVYLPPEYFKKYLVYHYLVK